MIALPPLSDGAVQFSVADPSPAVPVTPVGAPGAVGAGRGVSAALALEAGPVPTALVAATVNVYVVPLVSPVTLADVDVEPVSIGVCAVEPMYGVMR